MEQNYQEIATMVAQKCQEVLAPLYAELEELQAHYGMREAEQQPTEPTPTPTQEEIEDAELEKNRKRWQKIANELREQGKIK